MINLERYKHKAIRRWLFWRHDHTEAYRRLMDYRIEHHGPGEAVGGFGQGVGQLQYEFLVARGLEPEHRLLDIGCGTLRGGQYYIDHLDVGNYVGMDISERAIEEGKARIPELVETKRPDFHVNDDLRFEEIDEPVDYAIAQSVFSHLRRKQIVECFEYIPRAIGDGGVLFATYYDARYKEMRSPKDFAYTPDQLRSFASRSDLEIEFIDPTEYPHPDGQRMMGVRV